MSFTIDPRKDLTREVKRIARAELKHMDTEFGVRGDPAHQAVHDARKRIKRLRGLYQLIRPAARSFAKAENARLRALANSLSVVRDATALVETADKLAARFAEPADAETVSRLRTRLVERRDRIARSDTGLDAKLAKASCECGAAHKAVGDLDLPGSRRGARKLLIGSLEGSYRKTRQDFHKARKNGRAEDWHELRKLVKRHMMQVKLLSAARPKAMKRRARALDRLGELLGDDHDLAVLLALLDTVPAVSTCDRERIATLAETRTTELRLASAAAMQTLFEKDPGAFSARIEKRWRAAQKRH